MTHGYRFGGWLPVVMALSAMPAIASAGGRVHLLPVMEPQALAQQPSSPAERQRIEWSGELTEGSQRLEDGSYYNAHRFEGQAGEAIVIELSSEGVDAYVMLQGPTGATVAENDDGEGTDSRLVVTLPESGAYTILANTSAAGEIGAYQLVVRAATAREPQLARAAALHQQAVELRESGRYQEGLERAEESLALRRSLLGGAASDCGDEP